MLDAPAYAQAWEQKKQWYVAQDILPLRDGGDSGGALAWTDDRNGVDVPAWRELAESFLADGPTRTTRRGSEKRVVAARPMRR